MSSVDLPTLTTGPSARLALNDPTTLTMIGSAIAAAVGALFPQFGGDALPGVVMAVLVGIAGVISAVGIYSKAHIQGKLIANLPTIPVLPVPPILLPEVPVLDVPPFEPPHVPELTIAEPVVSAVVEPVLAPVVPVVDVVPPVAAAPPVATPAVDPALVAAVAAALGVALPLPHA